MRVNFKMFQDRKKDTLYSAWFCLPISKFSLDGFYSRNRRIRFAVSRSWLNTPKECCEQSGQARVPAPPAVSEVRKYLPEIYKLPVCLGLQSESEGREERREEEEEEEGGPS